jgi:polyhydroxyalkanoate synthesis regulator phasin
VAGKPREDRLSAPVAKSKDKDRKEHQARAESVRTAAAQAVAAAAGQAQVTRDRAQEIADELAGAAGRVREALEDLRPPSGDELRDVRARIEALEARVAELELEREPGRRAAAGKPAKGAPQGRAAKATPRKGSAKATSRKGAAKASPPKRSAKAPARRSAGG